jgi:hypothetical protein
MTRGKSDAQPFAAEEYRTLKKLKRKLASRVRRLE